MDKLIGKAVKKVMGEGEKKAPVKDIKLKVKFRKPEDEEEEAEEKKEDKKKEVAKKMK